MTPRFVTPSACEIELSRNETGNSGTSNSLVCLSPMMMNLVISVTFQFHTSYSLLLNISG